MDTKADIYQMRNANGDDLCLTETENNLATGADNIINEVKEVMATVSTPSEPVCLQNEETLNEPRIITPTEEYLITNDIVTSIVDEKQCSVTAEYVEEVSYSTETIDDNVIVQTQEDHIESHVNIKDDEQNSQDSQINVSTIAEYNLSSGEYNRSSDIDSTYDITVEHNVKSSTAASVDTVPVTIASAGTDSSKSSEEICVDGAVTETVEGNEELIVEEVEEVIAGEADLSDAHAVAIVEDEVTEEGYVIVNHGDGSGKDQNVGQCEIKEELTGPHHGAEDTENSVSEEMSLQPEDAPTLSPQDSIEQQLSQIVQDEGELPVSLPSSAQQHQSTISIAEAISRDFDESDDAEDQHQEPELVVTEHNPRVIEQMVDIADRLEHGPVTVTDNSGQVYYVESVEEVIVVENNDNISGHQHEGTRNLSKMETLDDDDVCVREYDKDTPLIPEVPPIPSHMLGRNIDNPVEDTFRNGKVPPKPRLGVKIPYKNLTSQIVSKDEIAREILERQRLKQGESKTNPANVLFTKKLTQRLAKKIAPTSSTAQPDRTIQDNSDLIAILEGNDDKSSLRSSKRNLTSDVQEEQIVVIDKDLEREIALKQLSELPRRGRGRRRQKHASAIENVTIPPRIKSKYETKKENKQADADKKTDEEKVHEADGTEEKVVVKVQDDKMIQESMHEISLKKIEVEEKVEIAKQTEEVEEEVKEVDAKVELIVEEKNIIKNNDKKRVDTKKNEERIVEAKKLDEKKVDGKRTDKRTTDDNKKIDIKSIEIIKPSDIPKVSETAKINFSTSTSVSTSQTATPIKTYERKRKSTEELAVSEKKVVRDTPPVAYVTKSSRIIKKKVIWDPDEPSTAKYLAEKVSSPQKSVKNVEEKKLPSRTQSKDVPTKENSQKPIKNDPVAERLQPQKLKAPDKKPEKCPETPSKGKKRLSEIDKLLMDEGAVNMLYSVKNEENSRKSLDKIQKDLRNITSEIKKDLAHSTEQTSQKLLRKKESPPPPPPSLKKVSRKKSKDSNRSSLHSPPPSPSTFPNIADASMIIRRHSNSSFSSVEGADDNDESDKLVGKRKAGQNSAVGKKRAKRDAELEKEEKAKRNDENFMKLALEEVADADFNFDYSKFSTYKTITVRQLDNLVQAILKPGVNEKAYLTLEVLLDLIQLLEKLQKDSTCNVVVVSSSASSFCHGINYKSLCIEKEQSRKAAVKKLAMAVTGYLRALANFPKILVAGVHGECVGLGVTMLPLFDMVISCDNAMFSIPNAKLGCAAEGGSLLSLPHLMHNVLVSELLYASRKLAAPEALRLGMVTRVIWPAKFQQELINVVKVTSSHSLQFMHATKKQLRTRMKGQIEESLSGEVDTLIESWSSMECQKNFASYD